MLVSNEEGITGMRIYLKGIFDTYSKGKGIG